MSRLRYLALLPSAAGLALCASALTTGAPPVAAQDVFGQAGSVAGEAAAGRVDARDQFNAQAAQQGTQVRQVEALITAKVLARRAAARREAHQDARQAARAALAAQKAAARAARQAARAAQPASQPAGGTVGGFSGFEQCVITAESGGNPRAYNSSSGASGLFGFLLSTWDSMNLGYPGGAYTAPASVQEQAFSKLYAGAGTSPWAGDGCA
jgi:hypothetical protein